MDCKENGCIDAKFSNRLAVTDYQYLFSFCIIAVQSWCSKILQCAVRSCNVLTSCNARHFLLQEAAKIEQKVCNRTMC